MLFVSDRPHFEIRYADWLGEAAAFLDAPAQLVRWGGTWNLIMLRLVSFATDYGRALDERSRPDDRSVCLAFVCA